MSVSAARRVAPRRVRRRQVIDLLFAGLGAMTEWTDVVGLVVQKYNLQKRADPQDLSQS
jgi:hypothetical protein